MLENMLENIVDDALGEYFRGSSSYEDAVTNRLNVLEATGIATTVAVANMKSDLNDAINATTSEVQGLRSDFQAAAVGLYNQGQGIRNDIQTAAVGMYNMGQNIRNDLQINTNAIQNMAFGVTSAIQQSTYTLVASQSMLAENFKQGFNAVNNTLDFGFSLVGNKIDVLSEEVSSKLDEIQDILNNPRLTQSRELYREALRSYKRGFYEEALADCLGAIEKNKTDYISWYLLGLIYLYGAGENSNVINLDKAEEAFTNAAKYIKPDIAKSDEAKLFASDIYYNLGFSRLAKSNDYLIENKIDDSNTKLLESEEASRMSYQLSNENLIAGYEHAKELHFLGKDDESLNLLEELIKREKNFAIKAINDKNFESLWGDIECLILKLRDELADEIMQQCNNFRVLHGIKRREDRYSRIEFPSDVQIDEFMNFYNSELKFIKNNRDLLRSVSDDFNALGKELLYKNEKKSSSYIDVQECNNIIKNVSMGRTSFLEGLDEINLLIEKNLSSFESELNKDYFFVLQKKIDFYGENNQKKLRKLSTLIINKYIYLDEVLEKMNLHANAIFSYLAAQKEWESRKLELRDKYMGEITEKCSSFRFDWKNRVEKMKNDLDDNFLLAKLSENMTHTKSILSDELNVLLSRIDMILKIFEVAQEMDYFDVLEKYIKFNKSQLTNTNSYFEYTLCSLSKEIKILKDSALNLMETK